MTTKLRLIERAIVAGDTRPLFLTDAPSPAEMYAADGEWVNP